MPYLHCPRCRLTVHHPEDATGEEPCPRCGATLAAEPRSLFELPPVPPRRFARRPPPALSPEAVRGMLARRGGRFRRTA